MGDRLIFDAKTGCEDDGTFQSGPKGLYALLGRLGGGRSIETGDERPMCFQLLFFLFFATVFLL
jgi:hypothetical protein